MIYKFESHFPYDYQTVSNWGSDAIGVYYLGVPTTDNKLTIYYIGRAVGDGGMRERILQHLNEDKWRDVTHFGYHQCDTAAEAIDWEAEEIARYNPKYNKVGVW